MSRICLKRVCFYPQKSNMGDTCDRIGQEAKPNMANHLPHWSHLIRTYCRRKHDHHQSTFPVERGGTQSCRKPQECTIAANLHFQWKASDSSHFWDPCLPIDTLLCKRKYISTHSHKYTSESPHKYISAFSHGCGGPVPGYINNGLATHDEREMPRHISSYCGGKLRKHSQHEVAHSSWAYGFKHVHEMASSAVCTVDDDEA